MTDWFNAQYSFGTLPPNEFAWSCRLVSLCSDDKYLGSVPFSRFESRRNDTKAFISTTEVGTELIR